MALLPRPFNILPGGKPPKPQIRAALAGAIKEAQSLLGHAMLSLNKAHKIPMNAVEDLENAEITIGAIQATINNAIQFARDLEE